MQCNNYCPSDHCPKSFTPKNYNLAQSMGSETPHAPLSKHQRGLGLSFIEDGRRTANDNCGSTVPTQRVLENPSHLAVPVWHMCFLFKKEGVSVLTAHSKKNYRSKQAKLRSMWNKNLQPGLWSLPMSTLTHIIGS